MSLKIVRSRDANTDEIEIAYYLGEEQSVSLSDRFLKAVWQAYDDLAEMPGIGTKRDYNNPDNAGMRFLVVPGFSKYLIFYKVVGETLQIIRVTHGARDLEAIFGLPEYKDG